jgi:Valyl-tRNA synthetase
MQKWENVKKTERGGEKKGRKVVRWKLDVEKTRSDIKRWGNRIHISKLVFTYDCFASRTVCAFIFLQTICLLCTLHDICAATQILNLLHFYYVRRIFL